MAIRQRTQARRRSAATSGPPDALVYALVTGADFGFVFSRDDPRMRKPDTIKRALRAWKKYGRRIQRRIEAGNLKLGEFATLPPDAEQRLAQTITRFQNAINPANFGGSGGNPADRLHSA